jgi:hypothetical protein
MRDEEFLEALERCTLPAAQFTHAAHVRAGYLYLRAGEGFDGGLGRMRRAIKNYAAHLGKPEKYDETLTVAYLALIHQRLRERGDGGGWDGFARENTDLCERSAQAPAVSSRVSQALAAVHSRLTVAGDTAAGPRQTLGLLRQPPAAPARKS